MSDSATQLLIQNLNQTLQTLPDRQCLWVVDENSADGIESCRPSNQLFAISNRVNVIQSLQSHGIQSLLADFNVQQAVDKLALRQIDAAFYRVSKEKAVCHHIINQAFDHLPIGGTLFLVGKKQEGIKTYIDKAKKLFGSHATLSKQKELYSITLEKGNNETSLYLDDQQYEQLRVACQDDHFEFFSKPGIFGWNKIDQGSAFLVAHLEGFMNALVTKESILDLGCGYGYLTLHANRLFKPRRLIATDNNITATMACEQNTIHYQIPFAQVITDHCGERLGEQFDVILCNPPFHQGFNVEGDLTELFLQQTNRLLNSSGKALFVVNEFIPLEAKAKPYFSRIEVIAQNRSFKLVSLAH